MMVKGHFYNKTFIKLEKSLSLNPTPAFSFTIKLLEEKKYPTLIGPWCLPPTHFSAHYNLVCTLCTVLKYWICYKWLITNFSAFLTHGFTYCRFLSYCTFTISKYTLVASFPLTFPKYRTFSISLLFKIHFPFLKISSLLALIITFKYLIIKFVFTAHIFHWVRLLGIYRKILSGTLVAP